MRKFVVKINGNSYEVEVEEIKEGARSEKSAPAPKEEKKLVRTSGNQETIKSPMPGNIWKITCQEGQEVIVGDVLLILEAMKMENEIVAARDGVVSSIIAKEGDTVSMGDKLIILD